MWANTSVTFIICTLKRWCLQSLIKFKQLWFEKMILSWSKNILLRLVSNTWVLFRAVKVIFVKIRLPKQVSADGESSGVLREFKSPVKFPISFFFFFNQSKDFCCEAVHCPRLKIIFHHKDAKIDNMSIFFLKIDKGLTPWRVDFINLFCTWKQ